MDRLSNERFQYLLKNPAFIAWVLEGSAELDVYWNNWIAGDHTRRNALEQARFTLLSLDNEMLSVTDEHIAYKVQQSLEIARRRESRAKRIFLGNNLNLFKSGWIAAASIIFFVAVGFAIFGKYNTKSLYLENQRQFTFSNGIVEVVNSDQNAKYVQLPDGSSVVLQRNSRISYTKQFEVKKRVVILSGDAFFEVTKDPERPFFVYANELVTKVLGTSFSIKANETSDNVSVAVKTGKVSVFPNKDKHAEDYKNGKKLSAFLLMPNQQATFERNKFVLKKSLLKGPVLLKIPIENQHFIYNETPVSEVFASLEKAYGIDIEYNEKTMAYCSITATLDDEPLDNKLKWICTILEAEYQVNGNKVNINGNPCN